MSNKEKKILLRIIIGTVLYAFAILFDKIFPVHEDFQLLVKIGLLLIPYFIIGGDVLLKAVKNITHGQIFDENFLMCIATVGAFCVNEPVEAVAVMLFYQIGEMFQRHAVGKSRNSIKELMNIRADYANIEVDGALEKVDPEELTIGSIIVVKPGERVPIDGVVVEGSGSVDTSALTGESIPAKAEVGSEVLSGCVNMSGVLRLRTTCVFEESTVSRILNLVETASAKKAKAEQFITKFARYYTPLVVISAVLLAVVPPLFFSQPWIVWTQRALTFLVISCPCALVISVPLSFFGGIGGASKNGILVKGGNYLEALSAVDTVVFDKTGTLTEGNFAVTAISPISLSEEKLLEVAAHAEYYSDHPIAISIKKRYGKVVDQSSISSYEEISGHGIKLIYCENEVIAGNAALMEKFKIEYKSNPANKTIVHIAINGEYSGFLSIEDAIKPDAADAIQLLRSVGVRKTVMLTGDKKEVGELVAAKLGIDEVFTQLLPNDKVSIVDRLISEQKNSCKLAFVGDGINDAPVLGRADVGIAMGGIGSDAAIEAADIVLMDDKPLRIVTAIKIARRTLTIVKQNVVFALGVKAIVLLLGALGIANMWAAVFADVGVSVIAIINAMRALKE